MFEHRSFLRSRKSYADIAASNFVSVSALRTAVRQDSPKGLPFLYGLFSPHPSPAARVEFSTSPEVIIAPQPTYFMFFGYLCGLVHVLTDHYSKTLAMAFPVMNVSYSGSYLEILSGQRLKFIYATAITFSLLFPFVMAFGSLGIRACLNQILLSASFIKNFATFAFQGAIFIAFFLLGTAISPLISLRFRFTFGPGNTWTLANSWMDLAPSSFDLIIAVAIVAAYVTINLIFVWGLRGALHGPSRIRPGVLWRSSIIVLWIYGFVETAQFVMYALENIFAQPIISTSQWQEQVLICLFLIAPIIVCGGNRLVDF